VTAGPTPASAPETEPDPLDGPLDETVHEQRPFADAAAESSALRRARRRSVALGIALLGVAVALAIPLVSSPRHPWFQPFDDRWRGWMVGHRVAAATLAARVLSVVGSAYVTLPLRLIVAGVLAVRRRWTQFAAFASAIVSSEIVVGVAKAANGRPRPPDMMVAATGMSFPSGHAIAAAVTAFGLVAACLPRGRRRWHWFIAASFLAASMSWSRTYLSVHWATDTVAGTCIGMALALLTEALFEGGRHAAAVEAGSAGGAVDQEL
jgi:undecaprenyl-diphosphatase